MPGLGLGFGLAAVAAYTIYKKFFGGNDDDPTPPPRPPPPRPPPTPPRDWYDSYDRGTTRTQTQQSYRPPPPSQSYTYRPTATNAPSQTALRTSNCACGGYHSSVVSPPTRTPSQTQPSYTRTSSQTQPSYTQTPSRTQPSYTQTPSQTQPSYTQTHSQTQPTSTRTQVSRQHSSLFNTVHVHESLEYDYDYDYFNTSSPVPSRVRVVSSDSRSDELASVEVEDLDFAKKLREQARRRGREMSEARSRAKSAQKKRSRGAAQVHRQEAIAHESAMKELDKRAAEIFFRENNKNRKEGGKIDLHGLHVAEAVQVAKDEVQTARSKGDETVRFIVGKGLHADAGVAKIRPALEKHFTKRGLSHSLDPRNAGVLIVQLETGVLDTFF